MAEQSLGLFEGFGIELEYMIVDAASSEVKPIADVLLRDNDTIQSEVEYGSLAWCNELVAHVIELKTNGPTAVIDTSLSRAFKDSVTEVNRRLSSHGARLMPTAMHPTMDPGRETTLWAHEYNEVYHTFDTIFDCSGHGWANLQSTHINLPFATDAEFERLHAAIRFILPIIPALSASSPIVDGIATGWMDTRLDVYRRNARAVPSVTGLVVPEPVTSKADYQQTILERIYKDLAPHDPQGILRYEWANARGAIARFDRNAIEIRVIDVQECPSADLAIVAAIIAAVKHFTVGTRSRSAQLNTVPTEELSAILFDVARDAEATMIGNKHYLEHFRVDSPNTAGNVWRHLIFELCADEPILDPWRDTLHMLMDRGCLARGILQATGEVSTTDNMRTVYDGLCECLAHDNIYTNPR